MNKPIVITLEHSPYAGYTEEDLKSLIEWECQDIHGGKMPFAYAPQCIHPECHPLGDDRIRKNLGIEEKADDK